MRQFPLHDLAIESVIEVISTELPVVFLQHCVSVNEGEKTFISLEGIRHQDHVLL